MVHRLVIGTILIAGIPFAQQSQRRGNQPGVAGDAGRGAAIFERKGACFTCHRIRDKGLRLGPDLTDIAAQRNPAALEKAVLDPGPEVQPQYRTYRAVTRDGNIITGKLLNQDTVSVQMLDTRERLLSLQKSTLREFGFAPTSPMPSYRDKLSSEEVADLIAYLATLEGFAQ